MTELCESSGLHSLAALREHEKRQAQQQADAARARAETEQRARRDAEREAARIEHERSLAEHAARAHRESAQHVELLRLEAAQRAEFERAEALLRTSAELKTQLQRDREAQQNAELRLISQLLRQRLLTAASAALCLGSWFAATGLYFGALRPRAERALESSQQLRLSESRARSDAQVREGRTLRRADELSLRVNTLEQDLRRERERRVAELPASATAGKGTKREPLSAAPVINPCRDDGDPLNPCLRR